MAHITLKLLLACNAHLLCASQLASKLMSRCKPFPNLILFLVAIIRNEKCHSFNFVNVSSSCFIICKARRDLPQVEVFLLYLTSTKCYFRLHTFVFHGVSFVCFATEKVRTISIYEDVLLFNKNHLKHVFGI